MSALRSVLASRLMRNLFISQPLWLIAVALFAFFAALTIFARAVVTKRCSEQSREEIARDAARMLTGLAATFAFFTGLSITITWGAVAAGQAAVDQQASAIQQMNWRIDNMSDRTEAALLAAKLKPYATAAAYGDQEALARGDTRHLASSIPLDRFEDALHSYAYGSKVPRAQITGLVTAGTNLAATSASVSAVAHRTLPELVAVLLLVTGVLVAGVMGISMINSRYSSLMFIWCVVPALSITVVIALEFPFAGGIGVNLEPLQSVAQQLAGG